MLLRDMTVLVRVGGDRGGLRVVSSSGVGEEG